MESLSKGLFTNVDPILVPEGGLVRTQNAVYRINDPAVYQAPGREVAGDGDQAANSVFGISWEPSDTVPTSEQRIAYTKTGNQFQLYSGVASGSPSDFTSSLSVTSTEALGTSEVESVTIANQHFLLSGGEPVVWYKDSDGVEVAERASLPDFPAVVTEISNGPFSTNHCQYWLVWGNSERDISGSTTGAIVNVTVPSTPSVTLVIPKTTVIPSNADVIHVYRSKFQSSAFPTPFPIGYRIATVTAATLASYSVFSWTVYTDTLIYPDATIEDNHLDAPNGVFRFTSVRSGGLVASVPTDSPLPRATTGDVFENSLVVDDMDSPGQIAYTPADTPTSSPSIFRVRFDTKDLDEVKCIRTMGSKLGVWLRHSLFRVNWLPRETDFDFTAGRVQDLVSADQGTFGPRSVAIFTPPSRQPMAAFCDTTGIYATDLYVTTMISDQIDWKAIFASNEPRLENDPDNQRLVVVLPDVLYYLHYDKSHFEIGDGGIRMAVTGPIERPAGVGSFRSVRFANGTQGPVSTDTAVPRSLFYENLGFEDSGTELQMSIESREFFPFGLDMEGQVASMSLHVRPATGGGLWKARLNTFTKSSSRLRETPDQEVGGRRTVGRTCNLLCESVSVEVEGSGGETSIGVNGFSVVTMNPREAQRV